MHTSRNLLAFQHMPIFNFPTTRLDRAMYSSKMMRGLVQVVTSLVDKRRNRISTAFCPGLESTSEDAETQA